MFRYDAKYFRTVSIYVVLKLMKKSFLVLFAFLYLSSCKNKTETIKPTVSPITESVYASGLVKSKDQYQAYATVSGIVDEIFVAEGDIVKKGDPILSVFNETQQLNKENAELQAQFSDFTANQNKLAEAKLIVELSRTKMNTDSAFYFRQKKLWEQQVGTLNEIEQRALAYQNSKTAYYSSKVKLEDLQRQLEFSSAQSKKNLRIMTRVESDFTLRSEMDGVVYSILKSKGEIVTAQTPLAVIGDAKNFVLEMQVDEYDIFKIKQHMKVLVTLDSYKGRLFEATVSKIFPIMNERSKTFIVEATFTEPPAMLYPNITFEANIIIQSKKDVLLIPRSYVVGDTAVINKNGDRIPIKTGLKDYQNIEVLSGLTAEDELVKPKG